MRMEVAGRRHRHSRPRRRPGRQARRPDRQRRFIARAGALPRPVTSHRQESTTMSDTDLITIRPSRQG